MKLKNLDVFTKVDDDFLGKSTSGGLTSIIIWAALLYLSFNEFLNYLTPISIHHFNVEAPVQRSVTFYLDLVVATPCDKLSIFFLGKSGSKVTSRSFRQSNEVFSTKKAMLREAAVVSNKTLTQQNKESSIGCRFQGPVHMSELLESIRIVPSESFEDQSKFNFSHRINRLSFGSIHLSKVISDPLQNTYEVSETPFEIYRYFVSVVPTTIKTGWRMFSTSQYAVTDFKRKLSSFEALGGFGIVFSIHHEAIALTIQETSKEGLFRFLVRLSGIVGGVYVCAGLIHSLCLWCLKFMRSRPAQFVRI